MKAKIISALLLLSSTLFGQNRIKCPKPYDNITQSKQITTVRKSHTPNFWGEKKFQLPLKTNNNPLFIKSVGDNSTIHGCLVSSENMAGDNSSYGIYNFYATPSTTISPLKTGSDFKSNSAVYANGKYYTFYMEESWGWVMYVACTVYNPETWEIEKVYEPSTEWQNVPNSSAITYDEQTGKIYAVTSEDFGGPFILSTFNENDGSFEKVASLERSYLTLAASPNGVLYGISDDGFLYKISKVDGTATLIGNTKLKPHYSQSMTFDPNTGLLYWAFMSDDSSALYQVNTTTATAYKICNMPEHQEFVGLYVNKDTIADNAPAPISDLVFSPNIQGGTTGTVSCVAPTKTADGKELTGNIKVTIYSGDEIIHEQSVTPGSVVKKDNVTFDSNTLYSLFAKASNDAGQSNKTTTTVYIGKDIATAPSNIKLEVKDYTAKLTWVAPSQGINDGYVNPDEITYNVVRNSGKDKTIVAKNYRGDSFSEKLPSATAKYSYTITTLSNNIEGGSATSNSVLSVGSYELPYSEDFSDGETCKQLFTFVDVDNDGHDIYNKWYWKEDEKLIQYCSDGENPGNEWLFTPAIHLDGKHLYNLRFNINMGSESNLKVTLGKSPSPSDQKMILDLNNINESWETEHTATFTTTEDADYYLGFYNYSNKDCWYFNLFDINIEQGTESNIPDSIKEFKITPDTNGRNSVTLQFKAPEKLLNGEAISGNINVNIYRENNLIKTYNATAGQYILFTDDNAKNGINNYKIVASYNGKMGIEVTRSVWAGYDISEPVKNMEVKTTDNNMHVSITWDAPEKGINNGFFDINKISYTIWRSLGGKNFDAIAKDVKELHYIDNTIEDLVKDGQEIYYYAVTANNAAGQSEANTQFVSVGKPYNFPVNESFENGYLQLNPWSYKSLYGELGWQTMRSDKSGGGWPQDNDEGFLKFANNWGDYYVDSRLITPVISMDGTKSPTFSFYMFHWEENSIAADNKQTKLMIEVAPDGGNFDEPIDTFTAANEKYGWIEHRVSLEKYKDCKYIQVALRGYTDNSWMYYYVDNINFDEQKANDLAIASFNGPTEANINDNCLFDITYTNRGLKKANKYKIVLKQDGKEVVSSEGDEINPGETKNITIPAKIYATKAGNESFFQAYIDYNDDEDISNNTSENIVTTVKTSTYPCAENLNVKKVGQDANITWTAPALPNTDIATVDDMEEYPSFAIEGFGEWISYDGDKLGSGKINTLPDFDNQNSNKAFQVWCPSELKGVNAETYPDFMPYSGNKCLIAWYANVSIDGANPVNDDYLISPEIKGGTDLSFFIKKINKNVSGETYQIMYSTTTQDVSAFKVLSENEAPADWEKVNIILPEDAKYFAIHYNAKLKNAIMLDDISYVPVLYALSIDGFNLFRNGKKINNETIKSTAFIDKNIESGKQGYQVSVVYNRGESNASEIVYLEETSSINDIAEMKSDNYTIYTIDGKLIGYKLKKIPHLDAGSYIINNKKITIIR